ncbi:hypothetical protein [Kineosporia sp. A_224]|uniref:hypothetical protein n=1 Tax=Kineosporia sp. A_224 TaxID=1962180 RepID=UPI00117ADEA4|nr:hypothetical protein [Kineosporia sp. A_224]
MISAPDPAGPRPTRMTYAGIRAARAGYCALPRDVRRGIHGGRLPTDPAHRAVAHEWARAYRFVAPVQLLTSLGAAWLWFSVPLGTGVHWSRVVGVLFVLWSLGPVLALVSAFRVLRAGRRSTSGEEQPASR